MLSRESVVGDSGKDRLVDCAWQCLGVEPFAFRILRKTGPWHGEHDSTVGFQGTESELPKHLVDFRKARQVRYGEFPSAKDRHHQAQRRRAISWFYDPTREVTYRKDRVAEGLKAVECSKEADQALIGSLEGEANMVLRVSPAPVEKTPPPLGRNTIV